MKQNIATTKYVLGQEFYPLPEFRSIDKVEVFNSRRKEWKNSDFAIYLYLPKSKLKTNKEIKIYFQSPNANKDL